VQAESGDGEKNSRTVHRNNSYYTLVLKLCELIHGQLLPLEHGSRFLFANVIDDETRTSAVFEEFVRVFYQTELREFESAKREDIQWDAAMDDLHASYLPKMQTGVTLGQKTARSLSMQNSIRAFLVRSMDQRKFGRRIFIRCSRICET
jgi:5-methylcytosine-specific restriction enzyme subunit McrC